MKILCTSILMFWALMVQAQITITNSVFPAASDTLRYLVDYFPSNILISPPGGPYNWNFVNLKKHETEMVRYRPAKEGMAYDSLRDANLVVNLGEGRESYYKVTPTTFEMIGIAGKDHLSLGLNLVLRISPPILQQRAPLTFPANHVSTYSAFVPVSLSNVPKEVLDSLKLPFALDSIRLRIAGQRNDFVDAYGSLIIPGGTYNVLREKRTEYVNTRLDAKLPFLGWQDITDLLLTNPSFEGLGRDTSIIYYFWNNNSKEAIAMVYVDVQKQEPYFVRYKNTALITGTEEDFGKEVEVKFSPNPFVSEIDFEAKSAIPGYVLLIIVSADGKIMLRKKWFSAGTTTERFSTANWPPGTFIYQLQLPDGSTETGKLIKGN